MILITSAAYINSGLTAEFGKLPPCMLPVQNRPLYLHQLDLLGSDEEIFLSLPRSFMLSDYDVEHLDEKNVKLVYVPDDLTLGESIVFALNYIAKFDQPLKILHGDTLIDTIPSGDNVCAIAIVEDDYDWAYYGGHDEKFAYTGYFAFKSQPLLIRSIIENVYKFIEGVKAYNLIVEIDFIKVSRWYDFGMVNSYYRSKSNLTTERVFNNLTIDKHSVKKYSKNREKIQAEANWYKETPKNLKHYLPALWDIGSDAEADFYEIEYLYLNSLADLYVFGKNPFFIWKSIIDACREFIDKSSAFKPKEIKKIAIDSIQLYKSKTTTRLSQYCNDSYIDMSVPWKVNGKSVPDLNSIINTISEELIIPDTRFSQFVHGDFCFSNILYDFKSKSIKLIDPRGIDINNNFTIYGDLRYDIGKLAHSIIGMYDFIIGGNYRFNMIDEYNCSINFPINEAIKYTQEYFMKQKFAGFSIMELKTSQIMIHLFLSMIPLHKDKPERQKAMLANALRLYSIYFD